MTTTDFAKHLISMVAEEYIDELIDLIPQVARPLQREIAKHAQTVAKNSILAKTEVHDDTLL